MKYSATTRSVLWLFLWEACFTTAMSLAKFLSPDINGIVLLFMRCCFGFLFCFPFILRENLTTLQTSRPLLHALRIAFACLTIFTTYYTYRHLPMAVAASIGFSSILITTMLAMLILKEDVSYIKWFLIIMGYVGVLIVVRPLSFDFNVNTCVALLASFCGSCVIICTKRLSTTESTFKLMFYNNTMNFLISSFVVVWFWETPSFKDSLILMLMGMMAVCSQFCYVKALKLGKPSFLAPFEYTRLILASCVGFFLFNEIPYIHTYTGAALIILATFILTRLELKKELRIGEALNPKLAYTGS